MLKQSFILILPREFGYDTTVRITKHWTLLCN